MIREEKKAELRDRLIEELQSLKSQRKKNRRFGMEESMNQSIGELSSYDNHPADLGSELFERGKDLALSETSEHQIKEIESALKRIDSDQYGICRVCHQPIPEERLEVVPWASTCVLHQQDRHISEQRPVEEKVIEPFERSNERRYDRLDAWQDVEQYGTSNPADFFRSAKNYNELTIEEDEQERDGLMDGYTITDLGGETEELTE